MAREITSKKFIRTLWPNCYPAYLVFQSQRSLQAVVNIPSLPIFFFQAVTFFRRKTSQWMANFDAIFDENLQEDEQSSRVSDENVQVTLEPVVIRGVGHMTV